MHVPEFIRAAEHAVDIEGKDAVESILRRGAEELCPSQQRFNKKAAQALTSSLGTSIAQMRAARVVSLRSRVAALRAGAYQQSLNIVAEAVELAAEKMTLFHRR